MTQKHTPKPWEYDCESDFIIGDNGDYICSMDIGYSCSEMEEKEANAHLIAAAPDLYEALKEALMVIGYHEYPVTAKIMAKALAKARGET